MDGDEGTGSGLNDPEASGSMEFLLLISAFLLVF